MVFCESFLLGFGRSGYFGEEDDRGKGKMRKR